MLPGFRFLFIAVVLSMSMLVFGFGAAALLRTAHEEFANTPNWQPAPETRFAQNKAPQPATPPMLAMLRVDNSPKDAAREPAKADQPASNDAVTIGGAEQSADTAEPPQPDRIAALQPAASKPAETAQPEAPVSGSPATESAPQAEAAPAPPASDTTRRAATEPTPPAAASEAAPSVPPEPVASAAELPNGPAGATSNATSSGIASLGGPPAPIAPPAAKAASAKSDTDAVKKRRQARREVRRRNAARAALSAKQSQVFDPFAQPAPTATATR